MGQGVPVREKGQTVRKRGGMDLVMASRMDGDVGVGMLNTVVWLAGPAGVNGVAVGTWGLKVVGI